MVHRTPGDAGRLGDLRRADLRIASLAPKAASRGDPCWPWIELMLMMLPPEAASMCSAAAWEQMNAPVRFTSKMRRQSVRSSASLRVKTGLIPALFTRMSKPPSPSKAAPTTPRTCSGSVTSAGNARP